MQKTRDEKIMRMICRLEGMSKRHRKPPNDCPTPEFPPENNIPMPPPFPPTIPGPGVGRVLSLLNDCGDMNQTQLAKELDIRPQSLSELIGKLEGEEYITKQQSPTDKRQTIISITDRGRDRVADIREKHRKEAEDFLSALSEDEKDTLYCILKKLVESHKDRDER